MIRFALGLFFALVLVFPVCAQEPASLFFSPDEVARIESMAGKNAPAAPSSRKVKLESLLFFDATRWAFWLSGKKWTPTTHEDGLDVLEVTREGVRLLVTLPDGGTKTVFLCPNQEADLLTP